MEKVNALPSAKWFVKDAAMNRPRCVVARSAANCSGSHPSRERNGFPRKVVVVEEEVVEVVEEEKEEEKEVLRRIKREGGLFLVVLASCIAMPDISMLLMLKKM